MLFDSRQRELALRREALQMRSAMLRKSLADDALVLHPPLLLADRAWRAWRWLRAHPQIVVGGAVVVLVLRPRVAWRLGSWAWKGWRLWSRVRGWIGVAIADRTVADRRQPAPDPR